MLIYHFTIHNVDGSDREETGRMALRDDNAARAFGKAIIRDIMTGDAVRYASWTMDISRGGPACGLPPFFRRLRAARHSRSAYFIFWLNLSRGTKATVHVCLK